MKATSGVVAGFGVGLLIALATLTMEAGPDINLVGAGFTRTLVLVGIGCLAVGSLGAFWARRRDGSRLLMWSAGLGVGGGLALGALLIFIKAGNITDATGATSPGSSWGVLWLIMVGGIVCIAAGIGLLRQMVITLEPGRPTS